MASRDVTLLSSLIGYVQDVKPYHTKIKEILLELVFEDSFNVNFTERVGWNVYHQNVWTRDDIGGEFLQRICDGTNASRTFKIPATVFPRFSLNDHVSVQTPPSDDPATLIKTDANLDGIPDSEQPWSGDNSSSHFLGSDHISGYPTRYRVPFHQGCRVYVDGVLQSYGTDFTVDPSRSYINFAVAPGSSQHIEVQLMKVDRFFIAYNLPFDYDINRTFDIGGYDDLPFDGDETPSGNSSDYFEFTISGGGASNVSFFNSVPSNVPKVSLTVLSVGPGAVNGETWRVTAIGPWSFAVTRSSSPTSIWYASFKEIFDNGIVSFVIDREWSNYYLVPDNNAYGSFDVLGFDEFPFDQSPDETDFFVDLALQTEHGVITDPSPTIHAPIQVGLKGFVVTDLNGDPFVENDKLIAKVKKISTTSGEYYAFVFDTPPPRGTYVELRIEQNGQLNPRMNAQMIDDMYLRTTWPAGGTINQINPADVIDSMLHVYGTQSVVLSNGATRLIHNVNIGDALEYVEPVPVDELVLYHGRGEPIAYVTVEHNGTPLNYPVIQIGKYFEGSQLPPGYIGVDDQRIVIMLGSTMAVTVTLHTEYTYPLLMMHMNSGVIDSSPNNTTFTPYYVLADQTTNVVNSNNPKFGSGSLNIQYATFGGTSNRVYISGPNAAPRISGDFSIKFWVNIANQSSDLCHRLGIWSGLGSFNWEVYVRLNANILTLALDAPTSMTIIDNGIPGNGVYTTANATTGTWYFCCIERTGNNIVASIDGVLGTVMPCSGYLEGGRWVIGGPYQSNWVPNNYQFGSGTDYIDEIRVDTYSYFGGVSFTPPAAPFLDI